jgi:cardiolipin synthase (CMP-forming)
MPLWFNLANLLTFLRVALTPFVVIATLQGEHGRALVLFVAAGLTDWLDGLAARRIARPTPTGAYFDPIADKCLLGAVYAALAVAGMVPWWFVVLVLGRDVMILSAVAVIMGTTSVRRFPPSPLGKLSTFFQIVVALVWMVRNAAPSPALDMAAAVLLWISTSVTLASGIDYTLRGTRMLRQR